MILAAVAWLIAAAPAVAAPNTFVTLSDGTEIAMNVRMPNPFIPGKRYPTVFEMSGYDGGSAEDGTLVNDFGLDGLPLPLPADDSRQLTDYLNGDYVTIHASVRGTGCSSGEFDIFSWRSALDGKEIIDGWIANQPWSNGDVAILGHSYGGITGFMISATQPRHLRAATVSGLIDDVYRALLRVRPAQRADAEHGAARCGASVAHHAADRSDSGEPGRGAALRRAGGGEVHPAGLGRSRS